MVDTARTLSVLQSLLADNTAGDISAQDIRDFLISVCQPQGICDFRTGLEDDVFISTSDQTGKSVIYLNSSKRGNRLCLSDGSSLVLRTLPKLALGGLTGLTSGKNYDKFVAYSTPTHSSTNTGTDIVTWTANPGWTTGTHVTVYSTGGGLTAGTDYWYNRASGTTGSFHTTLANALAGTSKVDLTGNITQTLVGVFMDLGPTWDTGSGSDTARGTGAGSTALTTLQGTYVNSVSVTGSIGAGTIAASAGVYVGTVRTTGTTTVEDSEAKPFVYNSYNQVPRLAKTSGTYTSDVTTTSGTYATLSTNLDLILLLGLPQNVFVIQTGTFTNTSAAISDCTIGVQLNSGTDYDMAIFPNDIATLIRIVATRNIPIPLGANTLHYRWLFNAGSGSFKYPGAGRGSSSSNTSTNIQALIMR